MLIVGKKINKAKNKNIIISLSGASFEIDFSRSGSAQVKLTFLFPNNILAINKTSMADIIKKMLAPAAEDRSPWSFRLMIKTGAVAKAPATIIVAPVSDKLLVNESIEPLIAPSRKNGMATVRKNVNGLALNDAAASSCEASSCWIAATIERIMYGKVNTR